MKVKSVVKVMNFHALLRVDKSRRKAEKYRDMERHLTDMLRVIMNNRNFLLDKKIVRPDLTKPPLEIYIGSDLGFCGSINSAVSKQVNKDNEVKKIIIGKKLASKVDDDTVYNFAREDYEDYAEDLHKLLEDAILHREYSSISIIYNHYYNVSKIELVKKVIYPLDMKIETNAGLTNDYVIESDNGRLLESIVIQYLEYELRIAWINAFASENIIRQSTTQESLRKIDEIEEEEARVIRKEKKMKSFRKVLDSYVNQKAKQKEEEE